MARQRAFSNSTRWARKVSAPFFGHVFDDITWCFVIQRTLACICPESRRIQIYNVLNATDLPEGVFVAIVFHEMLHLEIPPVRTRGGKWNMHPREFWEAEHQRSPNYDSWLQINVPLQSRPRLQCTDVVPGATRLTPEQRAWARDQYGVALLRVIRSDDL